MCSQHGLDSLKSDVECVTRCFGRVSSPVVLVGHSYGGTLITHAGTDSRVAALVYIAALAPDETETSQSQQQKFPVTEVFSHIEVADGRIWLKLDGIGYFAGDLPEAEQKVVCATQAVPVPDLFNQKVDGVAWRSKPSWYIVGTEDHTVHPELERFVAKRMGATTVELRPCAGETISIAQSGCALGRCHGLCGVADHVQHSMRLREHRDVTGARHRRADDWRQQPVEAKALQTTPLATSLA